MHVATYIEAEVVGVGVGLGGGGSFGDAGHVLVIGSVDDAMDSRHCGGQVLGRNLELGDSADLRW